MTNTPDISDHDLADIAALADGSLPSDRHAEVMTRVAQSPELTAELDRQTRATAALRNAQREIRAPAQLRARVGAQRVRRRPLLFARRIGLASGGFAAAAALTIALLVLPNGVTGDTLVREAAALHAQSPESPAPESRSATLLDRERFGVVFPNWQNEFGWTAAGSREDRVRDRDVATVLYRKGTGSVGYSVVARDSIGFPDSARRVDQNGVAMRVLTEGERTIVVFDRAGRTCVLSGVGVPEQTLTTLASWKGKGTVSFS